VQFDVEARQFGNPSGVIEAPQKARVDLERKTRAIQQPGFQFVTDAVAGIGEGRTLVIFDEQRGFRS